ncbi:hypothetical protein KCP69_03720 [Salmonella enterica subsp. enterica]|nr:hypothetical protein KCP69_03720 [Salmonella enterica subsp. enterica]
MLTRAVFAVIERAVEGCYASGARSKPRKLYPVRAERVCNARAGTARQSCEKRRPVNMRAAVNETVAFALMGAEEAVLKRRRMATGSARRW